MTGPSLPAEEASALAAFAPVAACDAGCNTLHALPCLLDAAEHGARHALGAHPFLYVSLHMHSSTAQHSTSQHITAQYTTPQHVL